MIFPVCQRRRRRQLESLPFPDEWYAALKANVYAYRNLSSHEQRKLRGDVRVLIEEKRWTGFFINDEVKVTIAAQAALLILGLKDQYFANVHSIVVFPAAYVGPGRTSGHRGVVWEGDSLRSGEAWHRGPVILSWTDALLSGRHQQHGRNLVLHEFAHQLDMQNRWASGGVPRLRDSRQRDHWRCILRTEYQRLVRDCERGRRTLLNGYASANLAEFFAVSTECFFERPQEMLSQHPALYEILSGYYCQDPARRDPSRNGT